MAEWAKAKSVIFLWMAGGVTHVGQVVGQTDSQAAKPIITGYTPADIPATIYAALGIELYRFLHDFQGRPRPILEQGRPIRPVIS